MEDSLKSIGMPWSIGSREPSPHTYIEMEDLLALVSCGLTREEILTKLDEDLSKNRISKLKYSRLLGAYISWTIELTNLDE